MITTPAPSAEEAFAARAAVMDIWKIRLAEIIATTPAAVPPFTRPVRTAAEIAARNAAWRARPRLVVANEGGE